MDFGLPPSLLVLGETIAYGGLSHPLQNVGYLVLDGLKLLELLAFLFPTRLLLSRNSLILEKLIVTCKKHSGFFFCLILNLHFISNKSLRSSHFIQMQYILSNK